MDEESPLWAEGRRRLRRRPGEEASEEASEEATEVWTEGQTDAVDRVPSESVG